MPSRNVAKIDLPNTFYHIYARGHARQQLYRDDEDYRTFLRLFRRHLDIEQHHDSTNRVYAHLRDTIELNCYCLMPNHFHLLVHQIEEGAMSRLMRSVLTSYSRYFNTKYDLSGSPFETTYKASMVISEAYLLHISRYIHLNPTDWYTHPYSSLPVYIAKRPSPDWLQPKRIVELFDSARKYEDFVADYEDAKRVLDAIKRELANY